MPNHAPSITVPDSWHELLDLELEGPLMILGGPGCGKSTLARWLFEQLLGGKRGPLAYLDADPGQSQLGPPTTVSLALQGSDIDGFPPQGRRWHWAVGSTSPSGHMLPHLVGLSRLMTQAEESGAAITIVDTCGLIDPKTGGHALKMAEVDLLRPTYVVALGPNTDMRTILDPLRGIERATLIELDAVPSARRRSSEERAQYRTELYKRHFDSAHSHELRSDEWSIFPPVTIDAGRLAALCDDQGFALGLAVAEEAQREQRLTVETPLPTLERVASIRLADIVVNPATYQDNMARLPAIRAPD